MDGLRKVWEGYSTDVNRLDWLWKTQGPYSRFRIDVDCQPASWYCLKINWTHFDRFERNGSCSTAFCLLRFPSRSLELSSWRNSGSLRRRKKYWYERLCWCQCRRDDSKPSDPHCKILLSPCTSRYRCGTGIRTKWLNHSLREYFKVTSIKLTGSWYNMLDISSTKEQRTKESLWPCSDLIWAYDSLDETHYLRVAEPHVSYVRNHANGPSYTFWK